jgi:hypothetical protein
VSEAKLQLFSEISRMVVAPSSAPLEAAQKLQLSEPSFMAKSNAFEESNQNNQKQSEREQSKSKQQTASQGKDARESPASTNVKESEQDSPLNAGQSQQIKLVIPKSKAEAFLASMGKSQDITQSIPKQPSENSKETSHLRTVMLMQLQRLQGSRRSHRRSFSN